MGSAGSASRAASAGEWSDDQRLDPVLPATSNDRWRWSQGGNVARTRLVLWALGCLTALTVAVEQESGAADPARAETLTRAGRASLEQATEAATGRRSGPSEGADGRSRPRVGGGRDGGRLCLALPPRPSEAR